ncbi:Pyruvate synthase subunit PorC [Koleobacter methoxysyntrophicus]|jgi:2-oxoglutarate ferredoxin oxidoreductase subunit gamma|uniref:Pyruvate synthase subunit PorC n=1 Tax=Koleobacter methoxysyntrophicus TaxID=2751313 RepID=A0A8A0RP78_9FIRM|nr:2-oxoacid:acceptor oxidoreductase family protein [Koleobacter methoxysyntrophicus]MDK2901620.1 2-oxoglutarate ferredoxin oxidoreductase subunit gamma [Thermosediminibacterales bacterium]NPV42430.1 2-oxoacid:acceptor oxidoreductase family protein [Bacillota bacterium]QSQ10073.1 Pyruvate synthase subunit PorC [Koleobacter methoxysyntrophicus]
MHFEIIMAGFGGQGIMLMGQLLAYAGMLEGKEVSWLPSYGPEMRGGTANCTVIVSTDKVGSPIVSKPNVIIVMNRPSLDKFEPVVRENGLLIYNSSLIDRRPKRNDLQLIAVPANEIANELGNSKIANMVALGAFIGKTKAVNIESVIESLKKVLSPEKSDLIALNKQALEKGKTLVE